MGAREAAEDWAREAAAAKCSLWMKLTRFNHASQSWEYVRRGKVGRWGGQRRLAQARRREGGGGQFYGGENGDLPREDGVHRRSSPDHQRLRQVASVPRQAGSQGPDARNPGGVKDYVRVKTIPKTLPTPPNNPNHSPPCPSRPPPVGRVR